MEKEMEKEKNMMNMVDLHLKEILKIIKEMEKEKNIIIMAKLNLKESFWMD